MFVNSKYALLITIIFQQLEHALAIISKIEDGPVAQSARRSIIKLCKLTVYDLKRLGLTLFAVYNDLSHPSSTSLSNKHAWRNADGSNNNIDMPDFGKVVNASGCLMGHSTDIHSRLAHRTLAPSSRLIHCLKIFSQMLVWFSIRKFLRQLILTSIN